MRVAAFDPTWVSQGGQKYAVNEHVSVHSFTAARSNITQKKCFFADDCVFSVDEREQLISHFGVFAK